MPISRRNFVKATLAGLFSGSGLGGSAGAVYNLHETQKGIETKDPTHGDPDRYFNENLPKRLTIGTLLGAWIGTKIVKLGQRRIQRDEEKHGPTPPDA